jgi:two-component system, chemotaxis family, CheB/CheR fusion protein
MFMRNDNKFPVVAVGASAGGLQAYTKFLKHLERETGFAYVFIQHLLPGNKSILPELLSKETSIPVHLIENGMSIKPDNIYVIPPDKYLSLKDGKFVLEKPHSAHKMPIDFFFRNIASEFKELAIGVILSGTADDGTLGLREIKAEGGLTFVQDEVSAEFKGMPHSAVQELEVDYILPPEEIAREVGRLSKTSYLVSSDNILPDNTSEDRDSILKKIFRLLWNKTGVDFIHYKHNTINRRINRRMLFHRINSLSEYLNYLKGNPEEIHTLYKDLLINVTNFFRDPDSFEALKKSVYPEFNGDYSYDSQIRIWIPGCSTGEEVYSIAISILEYFGESSRKNIQIFATDISDDAIAKARTGIYPPSIIQDVSDKKLKKYFVNEDGTYQILRSIRDMVVFAHHDITKDPPFSKIDLISCRNLLIYLSPPLQKKIISMFHFALKPEGFLMLGNNESIGTYTDLFSLTDKKHKIYRKKSSSQRTNLSLNVEPYNIERKYTKSTISADTLFQKEIDRIIFSRYALSGVLVNEFMDIIMFRGNTSEFLEPLPGTASLNLFQMVKQELLIDLRTILHKAEKDKTPVKKSGVKLNTNGTVKEISIEVIPLLQLTQKKNPAYFILFDHNDVNKIQTSAEISKEEKSTDVYQELLATKEYLKSIIEQRETSGEELRSTMEELQSSNEELQSINEEMETAKEELQSANEELTTVNDELQSTNSELIQLNNDLINILSSVNIPILVLDNELKIRRYTPVTEKLFKLIPTDLGRPVTDLRSNFKINELELLLNEVLSTISSKELEIQDIDGRWYSLRIRPYKTTDNRIEGVIVSFIDIDIIKKAYEGVNSAKQYANNIIDTVREPLVVLNQFMHIKKANKSFYKYFQLYPAETEDVSFFNINKGVFDIPELKKILVQVLPEEKIIESFSMKAEFPHIGKKNLILNARIIIQDNDSSQSILLAINEEN